MENELKHYGVDGQKWYVRRYQNKDGTLTALGKKRLSKLDAERERLTGKKISESDETKSEQKSESKPQPSSTTKPLSEYTDDELRQINQRLEQEKKYMEYMKDRNPQKANKGKEFALNILEDAGKNIGKQLAVYGLGTAVNKIAKAEIVNPKKGQKDK